MQYDINKVRTAIESSPVVKELMSSNSTFVGEYPRKVPTMTGGSCRPLLTAMLPEYMIDNHPEEFDRLASERLKKDTERLKEINANYLAKLRINLTQLRLDMIANFNRVNNL